MKNNERREYCINVNQNDRGDKDKKREILKSFFSSLENSDVKMVTEYYAKEIEMSLMTVFLANGTKYITTVGYLEGENDIDIFSKDESDGYTGIINAIKKKNTNGYDAVIVSYRYFIVDADSFNEAVDVFNKYVGSNIHTAAEKELQRMREEGVSELNLSIMYILLGKMYETGSIDTVTKITNDIEEQRNREINRVNNTTPKENHKMITFPNKKK